MKRRIAFALLMCLTGTVVAQETLEISLQSRKISSDSTEVTLQVGELGDSLTTSIWAFEFNVELDEQLSYLGVTSTTTLSAKEGWTTAANVENKWAGGFSSSTRAIEVGGTLVALYFGSKNVKKGGQVCLIGLRLNSGIPKPAPENVCIDVTKR